MNRKWICVLLLLALMLAGCSHAPVDEIPVSTEPQYLTHINFYSAKGSLLDRFSIQYDPTGVPVKITSGIQPDQKFELQLGGAPVLPEGVKLDQADTTYRSVLLAPCEGGTALLVAGEAQEPLWGMVLAGSDYTERNGYLIKVTEPNGNYAALFYSPVSDASGSEADPDEISFEVTENSEYFGYDAVLDTLGNAIKADEAGETVTLNDLLFSSLYASERRKSDIGYTFIDLDGNGTMELILGSSAQANKPVIYDLYTIYNGRIVNVLSGKEGAKHTLSTGNEILLETRNDDGQNVFAAFSYFNSSLRLIDAVIQGGGERFHSTESYTNPDTFEPIDYTEAEAIIERYIVAEYELTPLSDYMSATGTTPAAE